MTDDGPGIALRLGEDGVQRITIDRPGEANALSPLDRDALTDVFLHASGDPSVRAVLLRAAGERHFCTGAGLGPHATGPNSESGGQNRPGGVARMLQQGWQRLIGAVLDCDKPVVAAVGGTAAGAGASLMLACDFVVMSTEARFVATFVKRGILPDSGAIHLLARIVGLRRATELLMLGDPVDALTCERLGLANRVVAPHEVDTIAEQFATRLAAGPTVALGLTKRLLTVATESGRDRAFEQEAWAQEAVSNTADLREGLRAFSERREPRFRGW
ncbi:enoyl-CoA hydratase-related protein [Mycobacterium sp. ACS4331]|uniref:enoyl-CoA hydratase/isomerase family protein n=1 Tax=Mycobacterium sp. ACS4331 TaxID=1834121 RepID=UPI000800301C|nr:enoyl-CoA hydratase-related protein [Mycobacterium sp. ACS4331]OBF17239.1 enoyl-CoA hydratase [Mycobacterium sp. ACS4331]